MPKTFYQLKIRFKKFLTKMQSHFCNIEWSDVNLDVEKFLENESKITLQNLQYYDISETFFGNSGARDTNKAQCKCEIKGNFFSTN